MDGVMNDGARLRALFSDSRLQAHRVWFAI
jgi:hypothetical protein